jgi:hypothetical protein
VRSACLPASPILSLTFDARRFINTLPLVVVVAIDLRMFVQVGHPVGKGSARKVERDCSENQCFALSIERFIPITAIPDEM